MTDFQEIERRRRIAGVTREALYKRAGINGETYRRTESGRTKPNLRTLEKLEYALQALELEAASS